MLINVTCSSNRHVNDDVMDFTDFEQVEVLGLRPSLEENLMVAASLTSPQISEVFDRWKSQKVLQRIDHDQ